MVQRVAINGFGRIGRLTFRTAWDRHADDYEIVAINDPAGHVTDSLLLEYDSNYGRFPHRVETKPGYFVVDGKPIRVFRERDWSKISWASVGADIVLDCSGQGVARERAQVHLEQGARRVIISAPGKGDDVTIVMGVNEDVYDPLRHQIISNGSCTTNCLAPVALVLKDAFGLRWGMLTTVHSYTNSQQIHDRATKDPRESRAGTLNIVPTSTGAAKTLPRVLPEVAGLFDGLAFRVPTPTVSVIDFVCETERPVTVESVNDAFRAAARGRLHGIVSVSERPLVSMDFKGDEHSAIVDALSTIVLDNRIVKVVAWYDNEWGYSCRLGDLAAHVARVDEALRRQPALATIGVSGNGRVESGARRTTLKER